jgi:hypothetical protein
MDTHTHGLLLSPIFFPIPWINAITWTTSMNGIQ